MADSWSPDAMNPVKSGSFTVDVDSMNKKMRVERRKIWKHRAGVLVSVFGKQTAFLIATIPIGYLFYSILPPPKIMRIIVGWAIGFIVTGLITLVASFVWDDFMKEAVDEVKRRWNP